MAGTGRKVVLRVADIRSSGEQGHKKGFDEDMEGLPFLLSSSESESDTDYDDDEPSSDSEFGVDASRWVTTRRNKQGRQQTDGSLSRGKQLAEMVEEKNDVSFKPTTNPPSLISSGPVKQRVFVQQDTLAGRDEDPPPTTPTQIHKTQQSKKSELKTVPTISQLIHTLVPSPSPNSTCSFTLCQSTGTTTTTSTATTNVSFKQKHAHRHTTSPDRTSTIADDAFK